MLKRLVNEAHFALTITTTGPVLVRSGHATLLGPDMTPVLTFRSGDWQVYLPGSSLKGVLRSHLEKVCRTLRDGVVCDPFHELPQADAFCGKKFQQRNEDAKKFQQRENNCTKITSEIAYSDSCPICRLFGSTEFIGRVSINDAYLVNGSRPRPTETRDGVGIDRLTGGAADKAKFELEVVSSGVEFQTDVYLRNFETWQLGMLMLVVQDMEEGLVRVGSGRSRGLGSVTGSVAEVTINHLGAVNGKPVTEVWGLGKFLGDLEDDSYGTWPDDVITVTQPPTESRRGIRLQATFCGESLAELGERSIQSFVDRLQGWSMPEKMQLDHPSVQR